MRRYATFSDDNTKRYELIRDWRGEVAEGEVLAAPDKTALWVMLNPSVADGEKDDPTVRKVIGFSRRWGYGRVVIVNLCPVISTDPWKLPRWEGLSPENQLYIKQGLEHSDIVVAAWGSVHPGINRNIAMNELKYAFWKLAPYIVHCIGTTKGGDPRHPSRAPYTDVPQILTKPFYL